MKGAHKVASQLCSCGDAWNNSSNLEAAKRASPSLLPAMIIVSATGRGNYDHGRISYDRTGCSCFDGRVICDIQYLSGQDCQRTTGQNSAGHIITPCLVANCFGHSALLVDMAGSLATFVGRRRALWSRVDLLPGWFPRYIWLVTGVLRRNATAELLPSVVLLDNFSTSSLRHRVL